MNEDIPIKYFDKEMPKIEKISKGNWIDLRSAKELDYKNGDFFLIPLGIAMELPVGYEALVAPRSSTFKNYGIIQVNSPGVIDESYRGDNDQWFFAAYALRDGHINKYDRMCQFRVIQKMPWAKFWEVDKLENEDRDGFGSTGNK